MNTNFQVRKVTGYDPGYPVGRRRPGRLETRPLKFLFLVVGFLFFFVGFGCEEEIKTTGVQVADDDSIAVDTTVTPDTQPDYDELQGVTDPDFPLDDAAIPDADDVLAGDPIPDALLPDDTIVPDYDEELGGVAIPDEIIDVDEFNDLSGGVTPDEIIEPPDYDDVLTGDAIPDAPLPDVVETPDYDTQLAGELAPDDDYLK